MRAFEKQKRLQRAGVWGELCSNASARLLFEGPCRQRRALSLFSIQRDTCAAWLADLSIRLPTCERRQQYRDARCWLRLLTTRSQGMLLTTSVGLARSELF